MELTPSLRDAHGSHQEPDPKLALRGADPPFLFRRGRHHRPCRRLAPIRSRPRNCSFTEKRPSTTMSGSASAKLRLRKPTSSGSRFATTPALSYSESVTRRSFEGLPSSETSAMRRCGRGVGHRGWRHIQVSKCQIRYQSRFAEGMRRSKLC